MRVRYQVNAFAAAGLLTELAGEKELRIDPGSGPVERECALEELQGLLGAGKLGGGTMVDLGNGWERADACPMLAGICRSHQAGARRWLPYAVGGGLLAIAVITALWLR